MAISSHSLHLSNLIIVLTLDFQLSNLGIMTARLLPALQECFRSEYVSVRIEAAMVSNRALAAFKTTFSVPYSYSSLMTLATQTHSGKLV